jgi:pSer/pThr/pTyr-binding forkhead associated (FHA) protein
MGEGLLNEGLRNILAELIDQYGVDLVAQPRRLASLLKDYCGASKREILLLMTAHREGVPQAFLAVERASEELILGLRRTLIVDAGLSEDAAGWVVVAWGRALGVWPTVWGEPFRRVTLEFTDESGFRRVRVSSKQVVRLGRNPEQSDVTVWALPDSLDSEPLNQKVSRVHCQLKIDGRRLIVTDLDSYNGTTVDGNPVGKGKSAEVRSGQRIGLADALYYRVNVEGGPKGINAFSLVPTDVPGKTLEHMFLISHAVMGSRPNKALTVRHESISERHARLWIQGGRLWIEDLNSVAGTMVKGGSIIPETPTLIDPPAVIRLGTVAVTIRGR